MADPKSGVGGPSKPSGDQQKRPRTGRRRPFLKLGQPFVEIDDFANATEDAMAIGYDVLERVVKEIQAGYDEAKKYNEDRRKAEENNQPPPPIPWEQLVDRAQKLQTIGLDAAKDGTDILFDTIKSGTRATKAAAGTWERSRSDMDSRPTLAGPVFTEVIVVKARQGQVVPPVERSIQHAGLARLRIYPQVRPPLKLLSSDERLDGVKVEFEPTAREQESTSVLTIEIGRIPDYKKPGVYEGWITAKNFQLHIATLRVIVEGTDQERQTKYEPETKGRRDGDVRTDDQPTDRPRQKQDR